MAETETALNPSPDPETEKVIAVILQDFKNRGPFTRALVRAMEREIQAGGPLTWKIRQLFERR